MANMQQIKTPIGQSYFFSSLAPTGHTLPQLLAGYDLFIVQCVQWFLNVGAFCSIACNNSSLETVAVPRFMTTIPPA
jgi:hypothetical protein